MGHTSEKSALTHDLTYSQMKRDLENEKVFIFSPGGNFLLKEIPCFESLRTKTTYKLLTNLA